MFQGLGFWVEGFGVLDWAVSTNTQNIEGGLGFRAGAHNQSRSGRVGSL